MGILSASFTRELKYLKTSFPQEVSMLDEEKSSVLHQDRCKNYLSSPRIEKFVIDGVELPQVLENTYQTIINILYRYPNKSKVNPTKSNSFENLSFNTNGPLNHSPQLLRIISTFKNSTVNFSVHYIWKQRRKKPLNVTISIYFKKIEVSGVLYEIRGQCPVVPQEVAFSGSLLPPQVFRQQDNRTTRPLHTYLRTTCQQSYSKNLTNWEPQIGSRIPRHTKPIRARQRNLTHEGHTKNRTNSPSVPRVQCLREGHHVSRVLNNTFYSDLYDSYLTVFYPTLYRGTLD